MHYISQASILGYVCISVCTFVCTGKILHNFALVYGIWVFSLCKIGQKCINQEWIFKSVYLRLKVIYVDLRDKRWFREMRPNVFCTEKIFSHFG